MHFLRTLLPDEQYEQTDVAVSVSTAQPGDYETLKFTTKAERLLNVGTNWKIIDIDAHLPPPVKKRQNKGGAPQVIPAITNGEPCELVDCRRNVGKTKAPEAYTESSLREDMGSIAKYVQDPRLKAILKETSGIGTPATQANIIETLKRREYIQTKGKNIIATELGVEIIRCIPAELADPGITAAWEDALSNIAAGQFSPEAFMARVDAMIIKRLQQTAALRDAGVRVKAPPVTKGATAKGKSVPRRAAKRTVERAAPKPATQSNPSPFL